MNSKFKCLLFYSIFQANDGNIFLSRQGPQLLTVQALHIGHNVAPLEAVSKGQNNLNM